MTRLLIAVTLACAAVSAAAVAPAHAQKSDKDKKKLAKQYVDSGLAAQDAGDYDQAIELYEKAYEQVPHPILFFNIAQAQRLAGRDEEALAAYQRYLEEDPKGPKAKEAKGFVKEIQPRVDKARIAAAEKQRLADEAEAARKAAEAAEAERQRLAAEAAARDQPPPAADEPADAPASGGSRKKLGLVIGGSGLAIAATGAVFGVLAMGSWSDAQAVCGDDLTCGSDAETATANDLADAARLRGNVSTVLVGIGAAAIVTGAILYLTAPSGGGGSERAVSIAPIGGGAMVSLSGWL